MRLIDARALKEYMCSTCPNQERCRDTENVCSTIADIAEQPTVEAVGKEFFQQTANKVIGEEHKREEQSGVLDEETRNALMVIHMALFNRLERELFGGKENATN